MLYYYVYISISCHYIGISLHHCIIISLFSIVSCRAMEETRKMIKEKEREKERDDESKDGDVDVDASGHRRTFRARLACVYIDVCIFMCVY